MVGNCFNIKHKKCKFLLCCRYCQAPFTHFFLSILPLKAYPIGHAFIAQMLTSSDMSLYCGLPGSAKVRYDPCPHAGLNPRCFRSHGLVCAGGFLWRWDLTSPTTFYPCGLRRPSPNALCAFRRQLEGPEEATPSIRRRASQARNFPGSPPPAPRSKCDVASKKRLCRFEYRALRYDPSLKETPQGNE
jgi:hypothetical protein